MFRKKTQEKTPKDVFSEWIKEMLESVEYTWGERFNRGFELAYMSNFHPAFQKLIANSSFKAGQYDYVINGVHINRYGPKVAKPKPKSMWQRI